VGEGAWERWQMIDNYVCCSLLPPVPCSDSGLRFDKMQLIARLK